MLAQTYQDFEIVVVDDGSTDNTREVVGQFTDERIRYIYQENTGLAGARNTGIRHSTGEYVAFLDADDLFLPQKLALQVRQLDENPDVGLVAGGWLFVDLYGKVLQEVRPWGACVSLSLQSWLLGCPFVVHGMLMRRKVIDRAGQFDESLTACEDWDLFLRMAADDTVMRWGYNVVCKYRIHCNNMTRSPQRIREKIRILDKFFRVRARDVGDEVKRRAYANALLQIAGSLYLANDWEEAKKVIVMATSWVPELVGGIRPPLVDVLRNWSLDPRVSEPIEQASLIFDHLPESMSHLCVYRRKVLAELHIDSAFRNYACGYFGKVVTNAASGVVLDLSWIRNRGVWSITLRSFTSLLRHWRKVIG